MRIAIVTGGSRGFGRALAGLLAEDGWEVVVDGRNAVTLEETARVLGSKVHAVAGSITDPGHRQDLVEAARGLGGLDLLVNNAGGLGPSPLPHLRDLDVASLDDLFRVNVAAPLALVQLALPLLEESGGAIVNVTSDAAVEAYEGWGAYGSTKAALDQLSRVLGVEETKVHVWSFDPGDMRTEMHQAAFPGEDISDRQLPENVAPAILRLLESAPVNGRVRAADVLR
jgi:NAD(P)-dependent dehydrogenase (short-subunit alcohol dehydrogenase family)